MYCPRCRIECGDALTECPECHGTLLPASASDCDPALDLAVALESNNPIQLAMAKGLLENAGIPFFALGQIATLVQDVDPFLQKWVKLQVPRDRVGEAREALQALLQPENGLEEL